MKTICLLITTTCALSGCGLLFENYYNGRFHNGEPGSLERAEDDARDPAAEQPDAVIYEIDRDGRRTRRYEVMKSKQ